MTIGEFMKAVCAETHAKSSQSLYEIGSQYHRVSFQFNDNLVVEMDVSDEALEDALPVALIGSAVSHIKGELSKKTVDIVQRKYIIFPPDRASE